MTKQGIHEMTIHKGQWPTPDGELVTSEDSLDGAPVYRLYRGNRGEGAPGCLVVVSVEFEGPGGSVKRYRPILSAVAA